MQYKTSLSASIARCGNNWSKFSCDVPFEFIVANPEKPWNLNEILKRFTFNEKILILNFLIKIPGVSKFDSPRKINKMRVSHIPTKTKDIRRRRWKFNTHKV